MIQLPLPPDVGARALLLAAMRVRMLGGPGSGNFGHGGRPGEVGGSSTHDAQWKAGAGVTDGDVADASIAWAGQQYPRVDIHERKAQGTEPRDKTYRGDRVDGLVVRTDIPNTDSIASTFSSQDEYDELPGIRAVPLAAFGNLSETTADDERHAEQLAKQIRESGEIAPLIVVVGGDKQPYILEGRHRANALQKLGKTKLPAVVIVDHTAVRDDLRTTGGPGSGNFGHAGRPGEVGGSSAGDSTSHLPEDVAYVLRAREEKLKDLDYEAAAVLSPTGDVLHYLSSYAKDYIKIDENINLTDTIFTHNHPGSSGLSIDDGKVAVAKNIREMRAIGADGRVHSLRREGDTWPEGLIDAVRAADSEIHKVFVAEIQAGHMTLREANTSHHDRMYALAAAKTPGVVYTVAPSQAVVVHG